MSKDDKKRRISASEKARLEKALIRLIGSTRRSHRAKNLLEVAKEVDVAEKILRSRKILAEKIGISEEMLREFKSVNKLSESVKQMIKDGYLTSVDVAYRLSMLPDIAQLEVAQAYVKKELSGNDIKEVVALSKKHPKSSIREVIERTKSFRDIIQYVIKFRLNKEIAIKVLKKRFSQLIGEENTVSLESKDRIATLIVNEEGRRLLQKEAKKRGITKRKLINLLIERE